MHKAAHFEMKVIARSSGRSVVAAAAYRAGCHLHDRATGTSKNYASKRDVVSVETIGCPLGIEDMWNAVDAAERRKNSRLARELVISLPCELPLDAQRRLVCGYCHWLHEEYGLISMSAIHHPFADGLDREVIEDMNGVADADGKRSRADDRGDPRNHHVHILMPTRVWDSANREFGAKIRQLDDKITGPEIVLKCRQEWQRRVNSALDEVGAEQRVDLRSYAAMAAAGDAPKGLEPQPKLGPRNTARGRKLRLTEGHDSTHNGRAREEIRRRNDALWQSWHALMELLRERALRLRSKISKQMATDEGQVQRPSRSIASAALLAGADAIERAIRWSRFDEEPPCTAAQSDPVFDLESTIETEEAGQGDASRTDKRPGPRRNAQGRHPRQRVR